MHNHTHRLVALMLLAAVALPVAAAQRPSIPIIYSTDLYHPHIDLDDHFDLAQLFCLPELDLKAIILDINGKLDRSGQPALEQLFALTGRKIPFAVGLQSTLKSLDDRALDQPAEFQKGVELILRVLREASEPVTIITTGSLRDLVAAFNREPETLRRNVRAIHINIGNATVGGQEYNVDLDPISYRALMQSDLPIVWYPCFPADGRYSTYWRLDWKPLFNSPAYPRPLRNYFAYAMEQVDPARLPPLSILRDGFLPASAGRGQHPKEMWCTPSLLDAAGRKVYRTADGNWIAPRTAPANAEPHPIYALVPVRVQLDDKGRPMALRFDAASSNIRVFHRNDARLYEQAMTQVILDLYRALPIRPGR